MKAFTKRILQLVLLFGVNVFSFSQTIINIDATTPTSSIQQLIDNNPTAGTIFHFAPGTYRVGNLYPKTGQIFEGTLIDGKPATVLSGARELGNYTYCPSCSTGFPYVYSFSPGITVDKSIKPVDPICHSSSPYCYGLQDLFFNGLPLTPNQWQWEYTDNLDGTLNVTKIFVSLDPSGASVELAEKRNAFHGHPNFYYRPSGFNMEISNNVTIRNFVIEKYATPEQRGAVEAGLNWKIENNEIRFNHGGGIRFHSDTKAPGSFSVVRNNFIHHNGQLGVTSGPLPNVDKSNVSNEVTIGGVTTLRPEIYPFSSQVIRNSCDTVTFIPSREANGGLVELNTISYNNYAGYSSGWEAGGTKFSVTNNLRVYKNVSHDNYGPGFWTDIENINTSYEGNLSYNNKADKGDNGNGFFHEASYLANMKCNIAYNNRQNANEIIDIQLSSSKDVYITDNKLGVIKIHNGHDRSQRSSFDCVSYSDNSGYHIVQYNRVSGSTFPFIIDIFISITSPNTATQILNTNYSIENAIEPSTQNNSFTSEKILTGDITSSKSYYPKIKTSSSTISNSTTDVTYLRAWSEVLLQPGFIANPGFLAETCNCVVVDNPGSSIIPYVGARTSTETVVTEISASPAAEKFAPYPNPSNGKFEIIAEGGLTRIEVLNVLGKVVHTEEFHAEQGTFRTIDILGVDSGIYLFKIVSDGETASHKVLIVR